MLTEFYVRAENIAHGQLGYGTGPMKPAKQTITMQQAETIKEIEQRLVELERRRFSYARPYEGKEARPLTSIGFIFGMTI